MKIIKEGKLPEKETLQRTCCNCKTVFEFEKHEAKHHSDWRDGDFYTVNCPFCRKET